MRKIIFIFFLITIAFVIYLSARPIIDGNINFHTDIARDFLLFEDIYYNHNVTLIGPRSGGIPGVFHGPLWIYINVPAYIIGAGNPITVGWFWVGLFVLSIATTYYVGLKMFDRTTAMVASVIYTSAIGTTVDRFFNPAGAVLLAPIFYYTLWKYFKTNSWQWLSICLFILGCIIQFQMAFGVPILVVIAPTILYQIWKKKTYKHLLSFGFLMIPLVSYMLFELRHDFLQIKSVINYLSGADIIGKQDQSFNGLIYNRLNVLMSDAVGMITYNVLWLTMLVVFSFIYAVVKHVKKITLDNKYVLFLLLYIGYWIIILPYKGVVWDYYYWPFTGLLALVFASTHKYINKKVFMIIFIMVFINNFRTLYPPRSADTIPQGSWKFFQSIAEKVYKDAPAEFGYYTYTTDQFGYSSQYAMHQEGRQHNDKSGFPFEKKQTTYLLIDDPGDHPSTNHIDWRLYDVRIDSKPKNEIEIPNSIYRVEKYILNKKQLQEPSNPYMLNSLIFR
ncbi:MAG: hypothetical protein O3B87_05735 [bacterium]|nr:hypothetical protein [bacterium]